MREASICRRRLQRSALLFAFTLSTGVAFAQSPANMPTLPPGPAVIVGHVVGPDGPVSDVEVALYALTAQGHPGIGGTQTDANGDFRFADISNDPQIAYLVGARFAGIPFSERLSFEAGSTQHEITLEVRVPIGDTSKVEIASTRIRFDWAGSRLAVSETHVLRNPTQDVIYVEAGKRDGGATPLVVSKLPALASDFTRLPMGGDGDLVLDGDHVRYWGPFFPGEQELDFQYLLPANGGDLLLESTFPSGTGGVAIAFPKTGPKVSATGFSAGDAVETNGMSYESLRGSAIAPGRSIQLTVTLPELRQDGDALTLARTDLFLELDDASLVVNQEVSLEVSQGAPLVAPAGEALLRLDLPPGAELLGMSLEAASIGAIGNGNVVAVAGPLPPGTTRFGFRYAIPVQPDGVNVDLRFPVDVALLRIHIADTGDLVVGSNRLHRLRPERKGTRTYLQREAFQIEANERVGLSLARPVKTPLPRNAAMGLLLLLGAAACFFLVRPLTHRSDDGQAQSLQERISRERSLVYATIHDLDHDFETGKIAEDDYQTMRAELRASAIDLLRREAQPAPASASGLATIGSRPDSDPFCTSCGERVDPAWRFCSHCGGGLPGNSGSDPARAASSED